MGKDGPKSTMGSKNYPIDKFGQPGPGHYDSHLYDPKGPDGHKYSIGNEPRGHDPIAREHAQKPGPGGYDGHSGLSKKKGPSYGFGSSKRGMKEHVTPGPGAYRVPTKIVDVAFYSNAHGHAEHKFV